LDYLELAKKSITNSRNSFKGTVDAKSMLNINTAIACALVALVERLDLIIDHNDKEGAVRMYDVFN
jgi:hypothetical protein